MAVNTDSAIYKHHDKSTILSSQITLSFASILRHSSFCQSPNLILHIFKMFLSVTMSCSDGNHILLCISPAFVACIANCRCVRYQPLHCSCPSLSMSATTLVSCAARFSCVQFYLLLWLFFVYSRFYSTARLWLRAPLAATVASFVMSKSSLGLVYICVTSVLCPAFACSVIFVSFVYSHPLPKLRPFLSQSMAITFSTVDISSSELKIFGAFIVAPSLSFPLPDLDQNWKLVCFPVNATVKNVVSSHCIHDFAPPLPYHVVILGIF